MLFDRLQKRTSFHSPADEFPHGRRSVAAILDRPFRSNGRTDTGRGPGHESSRHVPGKISEDRISILPIVRKSPIRAGQPQISKHHSKILRTVIAPKSQHPKNYKIRIMRLRPNMGKIAEAENVRLNDRPLPRQTALQNGLKCRPSLSLNQSLCILFLIISVRNG